MGKLQAEYRRRRSQGEEGFTLIELLIVLVLMPLVVGGVAVAIITSLEDQQGVQARLSDSTDSVISSAYFPRDAQSAAAVTTSSSPTSPSPCSTSAAGLSAASTVFSLEWGAGTNQTVVTYVTATVPGVSENAPSSTELIRLSCTGAAPTPIRVVLSHDALTKGVALAITCVTTDPTCATVSASGWLATSNVSNLTVNVTQSSGYQYTVAAAPVSGPQITPTAPQAGALVLLGKGTDITYSLGFNGGDAVTVNGAIDLNSDAAGLQGSPPTIDFESSNDLLQSVANPTSGSPAGVDVWDCGSSLGNGASCPGSTIYNCPGFLGLFRCSGNVVTPGPTDITAAVPDPLAGWAQGNVPVEATTKVSCSKSGSTYSCPPGLYQSLPTFSNVTVNFTNPNHVAQPVYSFVPQLNFGGGDTVNFGPGIYGFYGSGGLTANGGLFSGTNTLSGSGVLFYFTNNADADFSGGIANKVTLSAATSGQYKGLLVWQDGSDSQTLNLSGFSLNQVNTYTGNTYAPNAEVTLEGWGNQITTGPIIAGSIGFIGSSSTIAIG